MTTDDQYFLSSRFARWFHSQQQEDQEQFNNHRDTALALLVSAVNAGEIVSLDGTSSPMSSKIKEHLRADNFEMNSNWIGSSQRWKCPCCARSKFEISRLGKKRQILAKLVIHHDHMGEALEAAFNAAFVRSGGNAEQIDGFTLVEKMRRAFAAYDEVLVCEDCNNADAEAKKLVFAPQYFSFSLGQIRRFIQCGDHQCHRIDIPAAQDIWEEARSAYELRMKLIHAVAKAAATDTHWYEPHDRLAQPIPVIGYMQGMADTMIKKWVPTELLYKSLCPQTKKTNRNVARWRNISQPRGLTVPLNYLAMLRSERVFSQNWEAIGADWSCPICKRSKSQVVYVSDKGKVVFLTANSNERGTWLSAPTICRQCHSTLASLRQEIEDITQYKPDTYGFVSPSELSNIIIPRPNSPHEIRKTEAAKLIQRLTHELTHKNKITTNN